MHGLLIYVHICLHLPFQWHFASIRPLRYSSYTAHVVLIPAKMKKYKSLKYFWKALNHELFLSPIFPQLYIALSRVKLYTQSGTALSMILRCRLWFFAVGGGQYICVTLRAIVKYSKIQCTKTRIMSVSLKGQSNEILFHYSNLPGPLTNG